MFSGVMTALVSPFKKDLSLDYDALKKLIEFQLENGVDALVPMGTTGESPTVSHEENIKLIEKVVDSVNGRVPVIAGTGSNSTEEALRMTKLAKKIGSSGSLQVAPYYNKPTQEGLYRHFSLLADEVDMPLIVYNIKGRTAVNIETDTLMRMAKHPNIVAVKEASGDVSQMMDVIKLCPKDFSVLSGDDNLSLPLTLLGGRGVISVAANIVPARMSEMISLTLGGDHQKALAIHYELLPLFKSMFLETNPIPVKYCLSRMGMLQPIWRLPLCPPSDNSAQALDNVLKQYGLFS